VTRRVFFDCETSGLDAGTNQILTFAIVIDEDNRVLFEREWKVRQMDWAVIDSYALTVNKINLDEHNASAMSEQEFVSDLSAVLRSHRVFASVPYGHNLAFDIPFLRAACRRAGMGFPFGYHFGDSMIFALALRDAGVLSFPSAKLSELCSLFGITSDNFHGALDDTRATRALYLKLLAVVREKRAREQITVSTEE